VLYAIGNSGDARLAERAEALLSDPAPIVRGAAIWALSRLIEPRRLAVLRQAAVEEDPEVLAEWAMALGA
jgi:epoxyqueuosine reductase